MAEAQSLRLPLLLAETLAEDPVEGAGTSPVLLQARRQEHSLAAMCAICLAAAPVAVQNHEEDVPPRSVGLCTTSSHMVTEGNWRSDLVQSIMRHFCGLPLLGLYPSGGSGGVSGSSSDYPGSRSGLPAWVAELVGMAERSPGLLSGPAILSLLERVTRACKQGTSSALFMKKMRDSSAETTNIPGKEGSMIHRPGSGSGSVAPLASGCRTVPTGWLTAVADILEGLELSPEGRAVLGVDSEGNCGVSAQHSDKHTVDGSHLPVEPGHITSRSPPSHSAGISGKDSMSSQDISGRTSRDLPGRDEVPNPALTALLKACLALLASQAEELVGRVGGGSDRTEIGTAAYVTSPKKLSRAAWRCLLAAARVLGRSISSQSEASALSQAATKVMLLAASHSEDRRVVESSRHESVSGSDLRRSVARQIRNATADVLIGLCGTASASLFVCSSPNSTSIIASRQVLILGHQD